MCSRYNEEILGIFYAGLLQTITVIKFYIVLLFMAPLLKINPQYTIAKHHTHFSLNYLLYSHKYLQHTIVLGQIKIKKLIHLAAD